MTSHNYTAYSLYSGAGGLDLGFVRAGVEIEWAIDWDRDACESYEGIVGEHIVCRDLLETDLPSGRPDIVVGGPPCQGFSVAGRMDPADRRSGHILHFLERVAQVRPRAFVMENVKALATAPRWRATRERLLARAQELGYTTELLVLNAAHYGVPQARERMFLVGLLDGRPVRPQATTTANPPTVREALLTLPRVGDPGNDGVCAARVVPARIPVMRPSAYKGSLLFNGSGRPLQLDGQARTLPASMGGNATPIVDQDELDHGAAPWVVEYHARLLRGEAPVGKAPNRMRRITTQEAAVLQNFSLGTVFHGALVSQYRQIGNAVPPNLAAAVARSVVAVLREVDASASAERARTRLHEARAAA